MERNLSLSTIRSPLTSQHSPLARPAPLLSSILGFILLAASPVAAQVLTIDTSGDNPKVSGTPVEVQFQQVQPTNVQLSTRPLGPRTRLELVRALQAEQGFAMRPLPFGHKGLTLEANGKLDPADDAYVAMVTKNGVSSKPGARVVVTNVRFDKNKIIFDLNGGPDGKHRFLSHLSVGFDPYNDTPVVQDGEAATGSRITLAFKHQIPELSAPQVKALLAPLVSFDVKTPAKAYTDTLPKPLKEAILSHQVLVGMNLEMLMYAMGQPRYKYHEMDGQMPVDIWVYGIPPQPVTFVRINGNRIIRVEIARPGKPVERYDTDVVTAMLQGTGISTEQAANVHIVREGDAQPTPGSAPVGAPPSLLKAGEKPPDGISPNTMGPVHFPKQQPDQIGANPDDQPPPAQTKPANGTAQPPSGAAGKQGGAPAPKPQNSGTTDTASSSN